ncbi:MAG: small ribosomal subunit Rsm22 family protein [Anaerolineae bacterium]
MELPADLRSALDDLLTAVSGTGLANTALVLSQRYREGHGKGPRAYVASPNDVIAYAASRLPATFAAVHAVLSEVASRRPGWAPDTVLDVGAGPGTAGWAASVLWPEIRSVELVEKDERMISLGRRLTVRASAKAMREAVWRHEDCQGAYAGGRYDLVLASYVLGELSREQMAGLIGRLWAWTSGVLVIVEPGTPSGFALVRAGRERLVAEGALVLAPCPHCRTCPMPADDWCHFAQRVARSRLHRQVKRADLGFEDEKYAYVAVSGTPGVPIRARVLRHPQYHRAHLRLDLCSLDGLQRRVVSRRNGEQYRRARDLRWGSALTEEWCDTR